MCLYGYIIAIDEGHGGSDPGAVDLKSSTEGDFLATYEKELNKKIGDKVIAKLKELKATVISTRNADSFVSLTDRCRIANNAKANLFVSIHFNAGSSQAHGIETFIYNFDCGEVTKKLGTNLQNELIAATGLANRKLKTANFCVLRETNMPAALVELGFITNTNEEKLINTDAYQEKVANAIVSAIFKTLSK